MLELLMKRQGPNWEMHNISQGRFLYHDGEVNPITKPGGEWVVDQEANIIIQETATPMRVRQEVCRTQDLREAIRKFNGE
jgi:hypothetical protein